MSQELQDYPEPIKLTVPLIVGSTGALLWIAGELIAIFAPLSSMPNQIVGVALILITTLPPALVIAQGGRAFLLGFFGAVATAGGFFTIGLINFFTPSGNQMMEAMEANPVFTVAGIAYLVGPASMAISMLLNGRYSRFLVSAILLSLVLIASAATIPLAPAWNGLGNILLCALFGALAAQAARFEAQLRAEP